MILHEKENTYIPMFTQNIDCVHVNDLPYFKGKFTITFSFSFVFV